MKKLQITVELVETEIKRVKGDWVVLRQEQSFPDSDSLARYHQFVKGEGVEFKLIDIHGYAPDVEKEVSTLSKVFQQEIVCDDPVELLRAIIRAANGI